MYPQEGEMLVRFLNQFNQIPASQPDPEANGLIRQALGRRPDALYLLVQKALMQEMALDHAQQRINELEQALQAARTPEPQAATKSSFLGGMFGGGRRSGWSDAPITPPVQSYSPPTTNPAYSSANPSYPSGPAAYPPPGPAPSSGGMGFLSTAATTAAGVAGGALLFQGVKNFFGGDNTENTTPSSFSNTTHPEETTPTFSSSSDEQGGFFGNSIDQDSDDWSSGGGSDSGGSDWI